MIHEPWTVSVYLQSHTRNIFLSTLYSQTQYFGFLQALGHISRYHCAISMFMTDSWRAKYEKSIYMTVGYKYLSQPPHLFTSIWTATHAMAQGSAISTLFHIHELSDAHDWLVSVWLTSEKWHPSPTVMFSWTPSHEWLRHCQDSDSSEIWYSICCYTTWEPRSFKWFILL